MTIRYPSGPALTRVIAVFATLLTLVVLDIHQPRAAQAVDTNCPTASGSLTGSGTSVSPYLVQSAADLQLLKTSIPSLSATYLQTRNIDMQQSGSDCVWDRGINGTFAGTYDGGGFEISGLRVTSSSVQNVGLLENVSGTVKNLGFTGTVSSTDIGSSTRYVGALIGYLNGGTIENSHATGNVSDIGTTGNKYVGGLVGSMVAGTIDSSYATGNVTTQTTDSNFSGTGGLIGVATTGSQITGSYATGAVSTVGVAGGLVGRTTTTTSITRSYATGDVAATAANGSAGGLIGFLLGSSVVESFAAGDVTGVANAQHLGGLIASMQSSAVTDAFATGGVSGWTQSGGTYGQVGGLVGDAASGARIFMRLYSATLSGMTPGSGGGLTAVGGVAGVADGLGVSWTSVAWNSETAAPSVSNAIGSTPSVTGITALTTTQLNDISTFTDPTGLNWNSGGAQRITAGYDPAYTWGICSAVNNGYPFLTAFYSSDPCTGVAPVAPGASAPTYTFSFLTSGGGKCLADVTVTRFARFTLPPASVACTPLSTSMAGWSIPGQDWAFAPGRVVTVVDSQVFTAVARNSEITITYDSNVNMGDECLANNQNITREEDRWQTVDTPRVGPAASLGSSAPCSPPGFVLIGWTDAITPEGSGQAQQGAQTYQPGAAIPDSWNLETTNPVNSIRLYALWGRSVT